MQLSSEEDISLSDSPRRSAIADSAGINWHACYDNPSHSDGDCSYRPISPLDDRARDQWYTGTGEIQELGRRAPLLRRQSAWQRETYGGAE